MNKKLYKKKEKNYGVMYFATMLYAHGENCVGQVYWKLVKKATANSDSKPYC